MGEKGTLIKMRCENWECPIPPVPNCYLDRDVCIEGKEWCMVETHEKWGQWAMGASGNTPDFDHCGDEYHWLIGNASQLDLPEDQLQDLSKSRDAICQSSKVGVASGYELVDGLAGTMGYNTWMPSRGKCVRFRQEGESCIGGITGSTARMRSRTRLHGPRLRRTSINVCQGAASRLMLRWPMVEQH